MAAKKEKLKEFTVDRQRWLRGLPDGNSVLQNGDGLRCCLGFLALKCGAKVKDIVGVPMPDRIS